VQTKSLEFLTWCGELHRCSPKSVSGSPNGVDDGPQGGPPALWILGNPYNQAMCLQSFSNFFRR